MKIFFLVIACCLGGLLCSAEPWQVREPGDIQRNDLELWSQCCFLRGALAYYEHTGEAPVLAAVVHNVDLFLSLFARGGLRYFQVPSDEPIHVGSRTHGLMYVDVLEKLFQVLPYEYCTILEMLTSLGSALQKTGRSLVADTDYPFGNRVAYTIQPEGTAEFSLLLRTPAWSRRTRVEAPGARVELGVGAVRVTKAWRRGDVVELEFDDPVRVNRFMNNELFVQKGALIYALGFATQKICTKEYAGGAFANYSLKLADPADREKFFGYRLPAGADLPHRQEPGRYVYRSEGAGNSRFPFERPPGSIEGTFIHQHKTVRAALLPMGSLLLRKVLFEQEK